MTRTAARYDIVIATDCRFPGGTSSSALEEVWAQHAAGYRTGVVHVPSGAVLKHDRPFHPGFARALNAGAMTFVDPTRDTEASLLLMHQPAVFTDPDAVKGALARVKADDRVMIVNQVPVDHNNWRRHYDPHEAAAVLDDACGAPTSWIPVGPAARDGFAHAHPEIDLDPVWVNVIDADAWRRTDPRRPGRRPIIGRVSRDQPNKWPDDPAVIRAVYPDRPDVDVRVLGGADTASAVLGATPQHWTVLPYDAGGTRQMLHSLDFFVYYHHPQMIEAFGRAVLEALASGVVAVLPPHFTEPFGGGALLREPAEVNATIRELHRDWPRYLEHAEAGATFAREHFDRRVHRQRVADRIGPPAKRHTPVPADLPTGRKPRALMMSSNGAGVGHLMRLMAIARRRDDLEASFFTLSQAVGIVRQAGWPVEHLPSRPHTDASPKLWNRLLRDHLRALLDTHQPDLLVFDGTAPYRGLTRVLDEHPELIGVWSRRAMWKPDADPAHLARSSSFTDVIEPGDWSDAADGGPTVPLRDSVTATGPVTYLDGDELLDRRTARHALGLPADEPAALVQLGAGNINDTRGLVGSVIEQLRQDARITPVVAHSAIANGRRAPKGVRSISAFPLARYLAAFDVAVAAPGYNTFHELLVAGVPTLFVPNTSTAVDDQVARAGHAADKGVALTADEHDLTAVTDGVAQLLTGDIRQQLQDALRTVTVPDGADEAAARLRQLADGREA